MRVKDYPGQEGFLLDLMICLWYPTENNPQMLAFVIRGSSRFVNRREIPVDF